MSTGRLLDYLGQGVAASRPVAATLAAEIPIGGAAIYYSYDTNIFNFLNTDTVAWVELDVGALSGIGIADMVDVDFTVPPADGQVLVYDFASSKWIPETPAASYTDVDADARVAIGIAAHEGLADPHPGYLTPAEGAAAYAPISHTHTASEITDFDASVEALLPVPVNTEAGTAVSAVLGDAGTYKRFTAATAIDFTIPDNATVAFPLNTVLAIIPTGAGMVTLTPAVGVTINSADGALTTRVPFSGAQIKQVAIDEWDAWGDLVV